MKILPIFALQKANKAMISRHLYAFLEKWKLSPSRLPLIVRGARQVGKTTCIQNFGKTYEQFLYFNLEKKADLDLFIHHQNVKSTIQLLFLSKGATIHENVSTLVFFDEIQEKPELINTLRYIFEDYPFIHLIASGSLLEFAFKDAERMPVGRIEFAEMHPLSFEEFLSAAHDPDTINELNKVPFNNHLNPLYYNYFHEYIMIGGMPSIVNTYLKEGRDLNRILDIYNGLIETYKADIYKYAKNKNSSQYIKQVFETLPFEIENRINLSNFGNLNIKSSEIKKSLFTLEMAKLIDVVYPTTRTQPPILQDLNKRPKLRYLDIGLANYQLGIHKEYLTISDVNHISRGNLLEQVVHQELKTLSHLKLYNKAFWVREEKGTTSEVDIVYPFQKYLIPIEIKSGPSGTLKSLHEFMDRCNHDFAIRLYKGDLRLEQVRSRTGKKYRLLNLPYFLASKIEQYIQYFM